jgi:hypothetical protein
VFQRLADDIVAGRKSGSAPLGVKARQERFDRRRKKIAKQKPKKPKR